MSVWTKFDSDSQTLTGGLTQDSLENISERSTVFGGTGGTTEIIDLAQQDADDLEARIERLYKQLINLSVRTDSLNQNTQASAIWRTTCDRAIEQVAEAEGKTPNPGQTSMLASAIYHYLREKNIRSIDIYTIRQVIRRVF